MMAICLSNITDPNKDRRNQREEKYKYALSQLGCTVEQAAQLLIILTDAIEEAAQKGTSLDFLGEIYMDLGLGSHYHGQYFTPYDCAVLSAEMMLVPEDVKKKIEDDGYISVADPSGSGSGVMLLAAADKLKTMGYNYQTQAFFIGQDIDRIVAQMCYIQLSLLGCAGYVCVANAIKNPIVGSDATNSVLVPMEMKNQEFYYTPFYYRDVWQTRITMEQAKSIILNSFASTNDDKTIPMEKKESKSDKKDKAS